jgi:sugar lactone lactonase YvrE
VQINGNGSFNQVIVSLADAYGMVADPVTGHLFVDNGHRQIYDVDPQAHTSTPFATIVGGLAGLAISADGSTLYAADQDNYEVVGYSIATGKQVFKTASFGTAPDGVAVGIGPFAGELFVDTNAGNLWEVDIGKGSRRRIADNGSVGSFLTIDPNDGSLLITQDSRIFRLEMPSGGLASLPSSPTTTLSNLPPGSMASLNPAVVERFFASVQNRDNSPASFGKGHYAGNAVHAQQLDLFGDAELLF